MTDPTYPLPPFSFNGLLAAEIVVLGYGYWFALRRIAPLRLPSGATAATRGQVWRFISGLAVLWVSASWPMHDLGEQYLFSFHMTEHMVLGFVAAPLILSGVPAWLAEWLLPPKALRLVQWSSHPAPAFFSFTAALIWVHVPSVVAVQITSELAHGGIHLIYMATALLAWMPVVSPHPALPPLRPPQRMAYLFAHSILPTIPASLLTFSTVALYPSYGDASLTWGLDPVTDQNIAGLIMKLGGGFLLWGRIVVIWFRWANSERSDISQADPHAPTGT
ncbi:MAG: cytochrome c oxidase assembly protein [Acidimicrobiia bacterium]